MKTTREQRGHLRVTATENAVVAGDDNYKIPVRCTLLIALTRDADSLAEIIGELEGLALRMKRQAEADDQAWYAWETAEEYIRAIVAKHKVTHG